MTWKTLVFLLLKFPLSLALGLVASPVVVAFGGDVELAFWEPATVSEAFALVPVGLLFYLLAIHLFNAVAWAWGGWARLMLGSRTTSPPSGAAAVRLAPAPIPI